MRNSNLHSSFEDGVEEISSVSCSCEICSRAPRSAAEQAEILRVRDMESRCAFITSGRVTPMEQAKLLQCKDESEMINYEPADVQGKSTAFLGQGSFGKVVLMSNKLTRKLVAVKIIDKGLVRNATVFKRFKEEIEIHKRLSHDNIIRMYESIEGRRKIMLVLEYASKGDLYAVIRRKGKLSEQESLSYFTQTCNALHFLHKHKLVHRDIKPENILLAEDGTLKLCDFGCCAECVEERKSLCGTYEYIAPEVLKRNGYNEKADIWSLGVLLFEMLHGYTPFKGLNQGDIFSNILDNKLVFSADVKEDAKELISLMLNNDPKKRPSILELLSHNWIKRVQNEMEVPLKPRPSAMTRLSACLKSGAFTPHNLPNSGSTQESKKGFSQFQQLAETKVESESTHAEDQGEILNEVPSHILYGLPDFSGSVHEHVSKSIINGSSVAVRVVRIASAGNSINNHDNNKVFEESARVETEEGETKKSSFWNKLVSFVKADDGLQGQHVILITNALTAYDLIYITNL